MVNLNANVHYSVGSLSSCLFFTLGYADSFSFNFQRQHVSSGLWDTFPYFGRSQQCCSLDGLNSSSYLSFFPVPSAGAVDYTDCISGEGSDSSTLTSVLDITLNNLMVRLQENAEYPFIAIAPRSTLNRSGSNWKVLSTDQLELPEV